MIDTPATWKLAEFKMYLFFYCADTDLSVNVKEENFITKFQDPILVNNVKSAFDADDEFKRTERIRQAAEQFQFTGEEQGTLMAEILDLFLVDGEFHEWEKSVMLAAHELIRP